MPERERRLVAKAMARAMRRQAAVDWFWHWFRIKWNRQPHPGTRITIQNGRHVPALWRSPRRYSHIFYEDCLQLLWDAQMLLTRLMSDRTVEKARTKERHLDKTRDKRPVSSPVQQEGSPKRHFIDRRFSSSRPMINPPSQHGTLKDDKTVM